MSCRRDEPPAIGFCGFHGSYEDYFGKQLTLDEIRDLYFFMSCALCTSIPITTQSRVFLMGIFRGLWTCGHTVCFFPFEHSRLHFYWFDFNSNPNACLENQVVLG